MKGNSFSQVILLVWLTVFSVKCEFFSSVDQLAKLVKFEELLLEKMEKFITLNENKLDYLKEKLLEFEGHRGDALEDGKEYLKNPINAYLMMKRLSLDWEKMENLMDHEVGSSVLKDIDKVRYNYTSRGEDDYNGVIKGILRLQQVYRLKAKDVAQGILGGIKYNTSELSAKDCFEFGKVAVEENNLLAAHAWLLEASDRFKSYNALMDLKLNKFDVLELLAEVKFKLGDFRGAANITHELKNWFPNDTRVLELHNNYTQSEFAELSKEIESEHEPMPSKQQILTEDYAYRLTCNGLTHPPPFIERELRCRYLTKTHPFLRLAPIKIEELNLDPYLALYHDAIYDSEIKTVIRMASNRISRSGVINGNSMSVSNSRTSQHVFIPTKAHKVLQNIDQRVAAMTGLNMDTAEWHQIANYGVGGHYAPHFDFFFDDTLNGKVGNRIATVLFFMSDVEQGGGTAFPYMSRLVKPKKGSALFWYNLHTSGDGDRWTTHGGCPVLVGSKWILSRWIRERGQEFVRPCSLKSISDDPE